ncbi:unnamed protein product [Somion occarium]|uniref:Uncharacterized protein n=1 Tax=Somion occarium TaxID=3059160 RepID=A0ABP1E5U9_9APHY
MNRIQQLTTAKARWYATYLSQSSREVIPSMYPFKHPLINILAAPSSLAYIPPTAQAFNGHDKDQCGVSLWRQYDKDDRYDRCISYALVALDV